MKQAAFILLTVAVSVASAGDWPMYRADTGRTGYSPDTLSDDLKLTWSFSTGHAPRPAWHSRERADHDRDQRMRRRFDTVFQPIIGNGVLYFGSSADDQVYALDAKTGGVNWTYFTDGPIRLAPVYDKGSVYVTSDDGLLHCVDAASGVSRWKLQGAPDRGQTMGNGRMISRWPCRGGAVIDKNTIYFGAGIWPSEKTYVIAADATTGQIKWRYSNEAADPTSKSDVQFKFLSQGHLALGRDKIVVPVGRISCYYFNRSDGAFLYGCEDSLGYGDPVVIDGMVFQKNFRYPTTIARDLQTNQLIDGPGRYLTGHRDYLFSVRGRQSDVVGQPRSAEPLYGERDDKKGQTVRFRKLGAATLKLGSELKDVYELISCSNKVIAANGSNLVVIDIKTKQQQTLKLDSPAWGLAVADGRLYASTERGTIYCFSRKAGGSIVTMAATSTSRALYKIAAKEIITKTGVSRGQCIDIACDSGDLAMALLEQTENLRIYALESDPKKLAKTRERFSRRGFYGSRITVHLGSDLSKLNLRWYGDLVVSGASVSSGDTDITRIEEICSPYLGRGCIGKPGAMKVFGGKPLEGVGNWTHMYADSGNTYNSNDRTIKGHLRSRWYADSPIGLPERHGRAQQPAICDGLMVIPGLDGIHVCNLYNGMPFWSQDVPGMMHEVNEWHTGGTGTGGHMCIGDGMIFARVSNKCIVFDLDTGKRLKEFTTPDVGKHKAGQWGYLAYNNGIVFGSVSDPNHRVWGYKDTFPQNKLLVESKAVFAVDVKTGERLWTHVPKDSIRNNTIAVDSRSIYFVDRPKFKSLVTEFGTIKNRQLRKKAKDAGTRLEDEIRKFNTWPAGTLFCLKSRTGDERWRSDNDVTATSLMVSEKYKRIHAGNNEAYGIAGDSGDENRVFDSESGKFLFRGPTRRSILNDFDLGGFDIRTGKRIRASREIIGSFAWRVKGCGRSSGAKYFTMLGNGPMRFVDRSVTPARLQFWAGVKANCWISSIPACGVVAHGSVGYGCQCNTQTVQATFVLEPEPKRASE